MKWNDLTMKERSDLMSLFLKAGVGSLSDMRHIYDGNKDVEYYGGQIEPAIVIPEPETVVLSTYPISKYYNISHSKLRGLSDSNPVNIDKGIFDPTYNIITNNCSDDTGRFLGDCYNTNFTNGIITPSKLQKKIKKFLNKNNIEHSDIIESYSNFPRLYSEDVYMEVPWYNYRKAVDNRNQEEFERGLMKIDRMKISKDKALKMKENLRERYNSQYPKLQYYIDRNNQVIQQENKYSNGGYLFGGDKNTINNPQYNLDAENRIYDYLRYKGLTHNQASAVMGNMAVESLLNADIKQRRGPAYGLIQAEGARQRALKNYNSNPYEFGTSLTPEEQQQLDYFIDKGVSSYTSGEWGRRGYNSARDARKEFNNPNKSSQELSNILMYNYFRPGKPNKNRRSKMTSYFDEKMSKRFPYNMEDFGKHYYDSNLNKFATRGYLFE